MTSLIFYTDDQQVVVSTDTLATAVDGTPAFFTTKAFPLPHLRMILAGTGTAGFLLKWFAKINDGMRLAGIDNLDYHTPAILRTLWFDAQAEYKLPEDITTTIYQFGFSEEDNQIRRYAYRSTSNFDSELLAAGLATKPACDVPDNWKFPNDLVTLMENQRERQATKPIGERVFIGGEIQFLHLTRDDTTISTIHRFDEYEQDLDKILRG